MATNMKLFVLCALLNLRLSKQSPSGGHHREHKVHNIVLYPDKHSWCKTTTIKQVINYPGCISAEINNNVCVGACFSYSIPRTEPSDPGEVIVPYCDSCQPSATTWHQITLQCDDNKSDTPPLLIKHVQIIHNCSCTLCDERYKVGNKVTYDIIKNDISGEPDDGTSNIKVASDLMLLQNLHAAQAFSSDIDDSTNSSNSTSSSLIELSASSGVASESLTEMLRSKRMQRILNQKIIALLVDIQEHNRPADKEQLLDLLHVAEQDIIDSDSVSSKSVKQQLAEIKQSLEGEETLSASNVQRIRALMQELHSFKLQSTASDCDSIHSEMMDTIKDDDSSYNDDNAQQFIGNDLDSIAQQTSQDSDGQEDQENKNEDTNMDEAAAAANYMLPIWLHGVNNAGDSNRSGNINQKHLIEITDIVEQRDHEQQQHATSEEQHLHHQREHQHHHQFAQHHNQREHDEANAAHKRHHHQQYHHHHHHHHYSKSQPLDEEELPPAVLPPLAAPEFLTNDALLLHRQHQRNVQPREQLDVNAHELKPNHAGTLLSYHSHVSQSDVGATVVADDDD